MREHVYTLSTAQKAALQGRLRDWLLEYLRSDEAHNPKLARHIADRPEARVALSQLPLSLLSRQIGPEPGMLWQEDAEVFERRVDELKRALASGAIMAPLIATDFWGEFHLSDGSHRFEAMKRFGISQYWTIVLAEKPHTWATMEQYVSK